jgi:excisionase family DNA binding protein
MAKSGVAHQQAHRTMTQTPIHPFEPLLDTNQAAHLCGIGRRTFQERVASGEIGCVKIGRAIRFRPEDLRDFIERNRRKAVGWKKTSPATR